MHSFMFGSGSALLSNRLWSRKRSFKDSSFFLVDLSWNSLLRNLCLCLIFDIYLIWYRNLLFNNVCFSSDTFSFLVVLILIQIFLNLLFRLLNFWFLLFSIFILVFINNILFDFFWKFLHFFWKLRHGIRNFLIYQVRNVINIQDLRVDEDFILDNLICHLHLLSWKVWIVEWHLAWANWVVLKIVNWVLFNFLWISDFIHGSVAFSLLKSLFELVLRSSKRICIRADLIVFVLEPGFYQIAELSSAFLF